MQKVTMRQRKILAARLRKFHKNEWVCLADCVVPGVSKKEAIAIVWTDELRFQCRNGICPKGQDARQVRATDKEYRKLHRKEDVFPSHVAVPVPPAPPVPVAAAPHQRPPRAASGRHSADPPAVFGDVRSAVEPAAVAADVASRGKKPWWNAHWHVGRGSAKTYCRRIERLHRQDRERKQREADVAAAAADECPPPRSVSLFTAQPDKPGEARPCTPPSADDEDWGSWSAPWVADKDVNWGCSWWGD